MFWKAATPPLQKFEIARVAIAVATLAVASACSGSKADAPTAPSVEASPASPATPAPNASANPCPKCDECPKQSPCPACEPAPAPSVANDGVEPVAAGLKVQVTDLEAKLLAADARAKLAQDALDAKSTTCDAAVQKLAAAEKRVEELSATPDAEYSRVVGTLEPLNSVADVDGALETIAAFQVRFPGTPQAKALKAREKGIKSSRKKLLDAENQAKAQAATVAVRASMGVVDDGSELDLGAALKVAVYLRSNGIGFDALSMLPRGSFSEAMKDPEAERGKVLLKGGKVIQISKDGEFFMGLLCADAYCGEVIHFVTPGTTRGIVQGKKAVFAGAIVQRYSYGNAGGGTTHAIATVGYFKGQP